MQLHIQQKKILFLTDLQRNSYEVASCRYRATFEQIGLESEEIQTPDNQEERNKIARNYAKSVIFHNTLGSHFVPIKGCYNIAIPAHEWSRYPQTWCENLNKFEEVWTTSHHVKTLLKKSRVTSLIYFMPAALNLDQIPQKTNWDPPPPSKPFKFLFCGESHFRKGHHLLMQGFMLAFPKIGEATLTIKMSPNCDWLPPRKDIIFIKEFWPWEKVFQFYAKFDCFVTASLAEGLGAPLAEAILARLPVAANCWGGHTNFIPKKHPFIIKHKVVDQPFCSRPEFYADSQKCALSLPHEIAKVLRKIVKSTPKQRFHSTEMASQHMLSFYNKDIVIERMKKHFQKNPVFSSFLQLSRL